MQLQSHCPALPINGIAENRKALRRAMHSQLMRAAGERFEFQKRASARPGNDPPKCFCRDPGRIGFHPPAASGIKAPERQIDQAFVLRGPPYDDGPIDLFDFALLEQKAELFERLVMAPEHQASGGITIE